MKSGLTRNIIKRNYALITPDGQVPSVLPGWTDCTPIVMISPALGAEFSQFLMKLDSKSAGAGDTGDDEWFLYVIAGSLLVNGLALGEGGFAFLPPQTKYEIRGAAADSQLLISKKRTNRWRDNRRRNFSQATKKAFPKRRFLATRGPG